MTRDNTSHTLRGCVDWNVNINYIWPASNSHTLRGCVDWNMAHSVLMLLFSVTPCVGVWIETLISRSYGTVPWVTPCVGVWIETCFNNKMNTAGISHTLRGCVDWNTVKNLTIHKRNMSHPAWVCGLKHNYLRLSITWWRSHPAWVCGLKLIKTHN